MALGFRLNGDGTYGVTLSQLDKRLITDLAPQMRELINERDPIAWRLFPNPYPQHDKAADEYQDMVGDELTVRHIEALETLEASVEKRRVTEEELIQWMHAVNHIRLVIGTRLNVSEGSEPDDYDAEDQPLFHTYWYLGAMLEMIVEALAGEDYAHYTTEFGDTLDGTSDSGRGGTGDTTGDTGQGGTGDTTGDTSQGGTGDTTGDTSQGGTGDTTDTGPGGTGGTSSEGSSREES